MELKELVTNLIKREFATLLLDVRLSGPFAEEDLCVDVILKELPEDLSERSYRIDNCLDDKSFDVLIGYEQPFEELDEATIEEQMERQRRETAKLLEKMSALHHSANP